MVDVGPKVSTVRRAVASGCILMKPATLRLIVAGKVAKGDVIATAELAGVMAAKRTGDLIPLCHPLALDQVVVSCTPDPGLNAVQVRAEVRSTGKTGVEMEALMAVSVAALTIYDMAKAADKGMEISNIHLLLKEGGKSGTFRAGEQ